MGDRSGGREPKGASLKKSKKNPGASAAKAKKASLKAQGVATGPLTSLTPPQPTHLENFNFDACVALLSRQFDRDRDRVLQRAQTEGNCFGVLTWFADIEKQQNIADLAKSNAGFCYFAVGIHPDNIDRTNKKSHEEWLEKTEELGKKAECLAILSGLNLSREMATHFSQESLLKSSYQLATKLNLPLVLHLSDPRSLDRALELLLEDEELSNGSFIIIHDVFTCTGGEVKSHTHKLFHDKRVCYLISGAGITDSNEPIRQTAQELVKTLDVERIVLGTDSPWRTPQNLSDPYLRTLRNESANLPYIAQALSEMLDIPLESLQKAVKANSLRIFGLEFIESHANITSDLLQQDLPAHADEEEGDEEDDHQEEAERSHIMQDLAADLSHTTLSSTLPTPPSTIELLPNPPPSKSKEKKAASTLPSYYTCSKCRTALFSESFVLTHTFSSTKKTVYKAGEEGLCTSFVFAQVAELLESSSTGKKTPYVGTMTISHSSVECLTCGLKVGKYYLSEAVCSCGKTLAGPVAKMLASKLDLVDKTVDTNELVERSKIENSLLPDEPQVEVAEKKKIKKGKKHKSENRGNFSSFRNKSFVPNASKVKSANEEQLLAMQEMSDEEGESSEEDTIN